eukprot:g6684.t1
MPTRRVGGMMVSQESSIGTGKTMHISFEVLSGPHKNSVFKLQVTRQQSQNEKKWLIGRKESIKKNGISLSKDKEVSSNHARIRLLRATTLEIMDLKSTNGTKINGTKIPPNTPYTLNPCDTFKMGLTEILYNGIVKCDDKSVRKVDVIPSSLASIPETEAQNKQDYTVTKIQVLANKDGKESAKAVERIECPICNMDITNFDVSRRSSHINACIERNEGTDAAPGGDSQIDTSIALPTPAQDTTNDLKIALELQKEENSAQTPNIYVCGICNKNMSHLTEMQRQIHLNNCIDKLEKKNERQKKLQKQNDKKQLLAKKKLIEDKPFIDVFERASKLQTDECLICGTSLKDSKNCNLAKLAHIKYCASQNNIDPSQMESLISNKIRKLQSRKAWNWMTSTTSPTSEDGAFEVKKKSKKRKKAKKGALSVMLDQGHSQKKRKRVGKRSALEKAREMDALNHAIALSKSLEDNTSNVSNDKDECNAELARLERRLAAVDAQIESMQEHRKVLVYNLDRARARAKARHESQPTNLGQDENVDYKEYGSGQQISPSTATKLVFHDVINHSINCKKVSLPKSSISLKFASRKGSESSTAGSESNVNGLWRASMSRDSPEKFKTRSKSVIEMNKFLISDENYESGDALSQLVRQVDESVHSSSCDECEDGEFNNTLEVSKPSLPDTTDNIDVTLSNCSETNALMNEDDKSLALLWVKNAPDEVKETFPNWSSDIQFVFQQSIEGLRKARENMLRRKNNIDGKEANVIACSYFVALIASAIEYRKQHDTTDENDIEAIGEITSNVDDAQNNATGANVDVPEIIDVEEEDGVGTVEIDGPAALDNSLELQIVNFIKNDTRLYEKILRYEAIDLAALHANLKLNKIKVKKKKLQEILDSKGVINS